MKTEIAIVSNWIKRFSTQRLHDVLAFNEDGKMSYSDGCSCLMGVTFAQGLHTRDSACTDPQFHYFMARALPGAAEAEIAYRKISAEGPGLMDAILRAEIRRRSHQNLSWSDAETFDEASTLVEANT